MTRCRGRCSVYCISSSIHALITRPHAAVAREITREVVHIILVAMVGNVALKGMLLDNGETVELMIVKFPSCSDILLSSG